MSSYNKVTILGNLTREPELRKTNKGTSLTNLSVAVNRNWSDESGQRQVETTFVDVTAWGRTAENVVKYLEKGRSILIEGRLQTDSWVDNETGKNRSKLKVVAENIQFIGAASSNDSQQSEAA